MQVGRSRESGVGLIEAAIAASVAMPLGLLALVLLGLAHDVGVVHPLPEYILAGQRESVQSWVPGSGGSVRVAIEKINGELARFVDEAIQAVEMKTLRLSKISAKGCYWVYEVDSLSGALRAQRGHGCLEKGALGSTLSLQGLLRTKLEYTRGIPALASGTQPRFLDEVVVWGVAVGGEFNGVPLLFDKEVVSGAAVEVPRREVGL